MSDEVFRRLLWSAALLFLVVLWTFAIIGVRATIGELPRVSIWAAAERPLP